MPDSGACCQGCSHCPNGRVVEPQVFAFSEKSLKLLESLQIYKKGHGERIKQLNIPLGHASQYELGALPLDPFPAHLAFSLGKVLSKEGQTKELSHDGLLV